MYLQELEQRMTLNSGAGEGVFFIGRNFSGIKTLIRF